MNQSKRLTEGALFSAIYIALMLVTFIPVLALIAIFLLPVPFVIYTSRHGAKSGALMSIVAIIFTALFFTIASVPLTILMALGGVLIGHAIYKKRSAYETLAYGTVGFIAGLLFTVIILQILFGINVMQQIESVATEEMQWYISIVEDIGVGTDTDVDIETVLSNQIQLFINLFPALLALTAIVIAFLSQWLSYKILNRIDKKEYYFPPFRDLKLPASIIWLYLIVIIASFFDLNPDGMMFIGVQNALMILEMLLAVQGFSFIFFFSYYKKWFKAIPIISIVITILFPIILLYFVRILGIIDIGLNLRERLKHNK